MASEKKPVKGILKQSSSFDQEGHLSRSAAADKGMKWDEMNIMATYHPADKDYGHTKIDEPPTPYNRLSESEGEGGQSEGEDNAIDPQSLAASLTEEGGKKPRVFTDPGSDDEEDDEELTEEEREKKHAFMKRRKLHYNEFQAVKLARQLIDNDEDDEDDGGADASEGATFGGDRAVDGAAGDTNSEADMLEPPGGEDSREIEESRSTGTTR